MDRDTTTDPTGAGDVDVVRALQLRALRVLTNLIARHRLPPLSWQILPTGAVHGMCLQHTADSRRRAWDAWRKALGAHPLPEVRDRVNGHPVTRLDAQTHVEDALIAITADLYG